MTRYSLMPHPDFPPLAVSAVTVDLTMTDPEDVLLVYTLKDAEQVVMPDWENPERANELWRATCFELFLRPTGGDGYFEFNFSPSSRWAAYGFDAYRAGMRDVTLPVAPHIERVTAGIEVDCDLSALPNRTCAMALTAVIEEEGGRKSYWALAHPPGAPDFHHKACFAATLPAPDES